MKENDYLVRMNENEYVEVLNLLNKMREEEMKQRTIQEQKMQIEAAIEISVSVIGIEETKRIMRQVVRDLRKIENQSLV